MKQKLVTTTDGVDIYQGDFYWCFPPDHREDKASGNRVMAIAGKNYNDGQLRFSTREKMKECIDTYKWLNE